MARNRPTSDKTLGKYRAIGRVAEPARDLKDGDIVEVTHYFADDDPAVYKAILRYDASGRCYPEPISEDDAKATVRGRVVFYSTYPIAGYLNWFMISNIPVLLSVYASIRCNLSSMSRMVRAES